MTRRFSFAYSRWLAPLFRLMGMGPSRTSIELTDDELKVYMGPWFRSAFGRRSIAKAFRDRDIWWAVGVHVAPRGRWIVNGTPRNTVTLHLDPPAEARCAGIRVRVRRLSLSPADPEALLDALGRQPPAVAPRS